MTVFIKRLMFSSSTLCYVMMFSHAASLVDANQIISLQCTAGKFTEHSEVFVIRLLVVPFEKQHE